MTTRPKIVDELKAGLEGVTPGPWTIENNVACRGWIELVTDDFSFGIPTTATDLNGRDYRIRHRSFNHIARCSPGNISALIEWGEAMERERDALALRTSTAVRFSKELARAEAAEAKVAELEAKLAARDDEEAELLSIAAMYGQKQRDDRVRELTARVEELTEALEKAEDGDLYQCLANYRKIRRACTARAALDKGERDV